MYFQRKNDINLDCLYVNVYKKLLNFLSFSHINFIIALICLMVTPSSLLEYKSGLRTILKWIFKLIS